MRKISKPVLDEVLARKQECARCKEGGCAGRLTFEHTLIYGGRQLDKAWAIIILCERHHAVNNYQDGGDLQKEINVWIALNQAEEWELREISKAVNYVSLKTRLNEKYKNYPNW